MARVVWPLLHDRPIIEIVLSPISDPQDASRPQRRQRQAELPAGAARGDRRLHHDREGDRHVQAQPKSTDPKAVPYVGAGIVVWQDSINYVFLGRAAINRNGRIGEFAAFEEREWGTRGALNNRGIDPGGVYLRLERRNNRPLGYTSKDGKSWSRLEPMEPTYPSTLKVGLYAINGCTDPMSIHFEDFQFTEGKATAKAKTRRR